MAHTPWSVLLFKSEQIHLLPIAVSLSELFCNETSRTWVSLGPEARHRGFWPGSSPGREELKNRRKISGKNMPRNPLHNLPENLLNTWPVLTDFIDLILGTNKIKCSRKISISALLTMPKPLTVWVTINYGKFWKRWEYQTTWPASCEICMEVKKQQLELNMEQQTGFK